MSSSSSTSTTSTSSTSVTFATLPPVCQHLKCYDTRETSFPRFQPRTVTLADQFESVTASVTKPERLCNPADKAGEGMDDPTAHAMCYRISESGFTRREVLVDNQFGQQTLVVVRPQNICLPAEKDMIPLASDPNHFKCYKVREKPGSRFTERTVSVADQFETKSTRVIRPLLLCNPVDKNGEGIPSPSCHLVCYRIKDAVGQTPLPPQDVLVTDQFTSGDVHAFTGDCRKVAYLCVPSTKTELP
jgi:hypothetical protein